MGWKSTVDITREDAIKLVVDRLTIVCTLSDRELEDLLVQLGYGDDINLPYCGHNFLIIDEKKK